MTVNKLTYVKGLKQCLVHSRRHMCLLLSFKVSTGKNEQITLTPLLMAENTGLVHQETSDSLDANSGRVNLNFPCLRLQSRCKMMRDFRKVQIKACSKGSKTKLKCSSLLILPSSSNLKRSFQNIL